MPSPERIETLKNPKQDAVIGICHSDPGKFRESYWRKLLQWQIDGNGERQLSLLIAHPDKEGGLKTLSSMDIRRKVQGLPENERDNFLSEIIEEILQAKQVRLIETNEEKFIPIHENPPSPEVSPIITVKNPTDIETRLILKQQSKNGSRIIAKWDSPDGKPENTLSIDLSQPRTPRAIERLSQRLNGVHRLSIISS